MSVLYKLVEAIASFLEVFMAFTVTRTICDKKNKDMKSDVIFAVVGMFIIRIGNSFAVFSYLTIMFSYIFIVAYITIKYKIELLKSALSVGFWMFLMNTYSFASISVVSLLKNGESLYYPIMYEEGIERILFIVFAQIGWMLISLAVNYLFSKTHVMHDFGMKSLLFVLFGVIGTVFLVEQTLSAFNIFMANMWLALIAFLLLIVFTLYLGMMDRENNLKLQMMEIRNNLLEDKYQSIREVYSNNAKLYHDMNNHFQILYQLLEAKKLEDAKEYLSKISEPMVALSKKTWTGNEILDVVINNKIDEMKKKKIAYEVNAEPFAKCTITTHDLSMILYNLMDNAIESTAHMENERKIMLTIRPVNQFLAVKVTNPCEKTFSFTGSYPKTTKKDKILHGWGLKSVSDIVKKYDGSMNCENKDGVFEVMILLPMNK